MDAILSSIPPWLTAGVITIGLLIGALVRGWKAGDKDLASGNVGELAKVKGPVVVDQASIVKGALAAAIEGLSATITIELVPALKALMSQGVKVNSEELEDRIKALSDELDKVREELRISREVERMHR